MSHLPQEILRVAFSRGFKGAKGFFYFWRTIYFFFLGNNLLFPKIAVFSSNILPEQEVSFLNKSFQNTRSRNHGRCRHPLISEDQYPITVHWEIHFVLTFEILLTLHSTIKQDFSSFSLWSDRTAWFRKKYFDYHCPVNTFDRLRVAILQECMLWFYFSLKKYRFKEWGKILLFKISYF